jgi:UDP-3-O-acyl-N-acetylglucosamine deacetylase
LKFKKSDELEIEYIIDRFGQKFSACAKIKTIADLEKILSARTFIFEQELSVAKLSENLKGCGVILQSDGKNDLRFENEPAYHKILDFLGDITLYSNALPCGKFTIFNGGHELHHKCYGYYP